MAKQIAWLCEDHWDRCLRGNPCETCPSRPENKDAVEKLAKLHPAELALLNSAVLKRIGELAIQVEGDQNGLRSIRKLINTLETKTAVMQNQIEWHERVNAQQSTTTEKWLGRITVIVTTLIALVALVISIWKPI